MKISFTRDGRFEEALGPGTVHADIAPTLAWHDELARAGTLDAQLTLAAGRVAGHIDTTAPFTSRANPLAVTNNGAVE